MQRKSLTSLITTIACAILALSAVTQLQAQEKKADPTGTWTWSVPGRDGGAAMVSTLKLKAEGEKLTGTLTTPGRQGGQARDAAIENGKVKGDEVSFSVTREFNNNKRTTKYNGKLSGDTIKGKMEFENRNGETQTRDWEAKRATEKSATEKK
jgi:hypothetical protein